MSARPFDCGGKQCDGTTTYCLSNSTSGGAGTGGSYGSSNVCKPYPYNCKPTPSCGCLSAIGNGICTCYFDDGGFTVSCHTFYGGGGM